MITLLRPSEDAFSDAIEERLKDLVVAHTVRRVPADERSMPEVRDNDRTYTSRDDILGFLDALTTEVKASWAVSADACMIDPDTGKTC